MTFRRPSTPLCLSEVGSPTEFPSVGETRHSRVFVREYVGFVETPYYYCRTKNTCGRPPSGSLYRITIQEYRAHLALCSLCVARRYFF